MRFPISSLDWKILNNFDQKSESYNTNLDKFNEYCLNHEKGARLWQMCRVRWLIESKPQVLFHAVADCRIFSKNNCWHNYVRECEGDLIMYLKRNCPFYHMIHHIGV